MDMVVRYGGDEFLALLVRPEESLETVRRRIREALAEWNEKNNLLDSPIRLSIGGAVWSPDETESVEEVLARADRAMYADKE
jgi:diguanylate cyclase (GGDEF)-like protein